MAGHVEFLNSAPVLNFAIGTHPRQDVSATTEDKSSTCAVNISTTSTQNPLVRQQLISTPEDHNHLSPLSILDESAAFAHSFGVVSNGSGKFGRESDGVWFPFFPQDSIT